ncbi:MAG TPA: ComEC/Rec2 family competence protein, partial [candidate division Zixibacteria bacterium]|nr:ComEC/Rec2 family competence protein [candidate division Zixibacteria bacterium]
NRLTKLRDFVEHELTEGLPPKAAGVIRGFVLGDTREIEPSAYELFRKTGTLHLLAVSGANVAWVALFPIFLLKLFHISLRWRYWAALGAVWLFVLLTDLQASVLRAALMFTVWTASRVIHREISGLQSLGLCGLLLLTVNPLWFFDIGFELSFLAVFALIFSFAERDEYEKNWVKRWLVWPFRNNLSNSAAVFLLISPLLAYYFNQVAWASLLVNVVAMPLTALITWTALVRLGISFLDFFGPLVFVQEKLFEGLFWVQNLFVNLPHTLLRIPHPNGLETFLLTAAGFGLLLVLFKSQYRKAGLYLFLIGLTPVVWVWAFKRPPEFALTVLEAKGEMVSVLSLPGGTLVVGGGAVRESQHTPRQTLEPFLAYLGKDKIDGYLPVRFDSSGWTASEEIAGKFRPDFIGWPAAGNRNGTAVGPTDIKFEYLLVIEDSVPFALRLICPDFAFLFIRQLKRSRPPRWDSLLAGPTVLVASLEVAQAESLTALANVKAVVSTRQRYQLPPTRPDEAFFTFRDGAVTFQAKEDGLAAQSHLSKRKRFLAKQ